ncbi:MAG: tRNA (N(6)-L-threonylcarbamoyladenosine(37)-C(2))-methylthiotransferase MtaB [Cytophagaceae bacterium]|nr:tRNA (N(6)-L-threonylcarbamoyladenosine(37)-C(2))-methylthiotransferase MtaB [Cytophagaceae bacterium]MDW8456011.1 tRNA (N(6)-L-threonylcarbamoyladenosine(37)-C(2))-methylthiotransferase MtaB [Cytophagaceae bacterium]
MKNVAFYTLGCKLNYSETSTIARMFTDAGYKKVDFQHTPDIFIINTCSVTDNADKKCRKIVKEALKISPHAFIAIIGCYAQLKPHEIASIPGVDAVLGASEKFKLLELIKNFEKKKHPHIYHQPISQATDYYCSYSVNDRTRTFLKIQDGCDYSCSFCTIPLARGKSRSDTIENIVKTAEKIAQTGVKEIVLTGVNIGDYGIIEGSRQHKFLDLIQQLDRVDGVERFRISSIEPNLLTDEIIQFVKHSEKFVPHFHVPLQSGSDAILKKMKRRYLSALYKDRVLSIKKHMPHCCIGADVIVGFPGETDEHFLETYRFIEDLEISYLHVFTYSERNNTPAATMPESIPAHTRSLRSKLLHELSDKKKQKFYASQAGTTHKVLWEDDIENELMFGFTENYVRVAQPYDPLFINEIQQVKLSHSLQSSYMLAIECITV